LNDIINIPQDADITMDTIKGLIFELSVSIIRTFNKVCKRYIYGSTHQKMLDIGYELKFQDVREWLFGMKECNFVLLELSRLTRTFKIFPNNSVIGQRKDFFKKSGVLYLERMIPDDHIGYYSGITDNIVNFTKSCNKVNEWFTGSKDQWVRAKAKEYVLKGCLPMIYKYTKGVHSTFFVNKKLDNSFEIGDL
jgi:hypothetical protein